MATDNEQKKDQEIKDEDVEIEAEIVDDDTDNPEDEVVEEKKEEVNEYKDKYQRLLADFSNYKTREEKAKSDFKKFASSNLLEKLLPVLDNFDRALKDANEEDSFVQGIVMTRDSMLKILEEEGLSEIESDGAKFDPNYHHAVLAEESEKVEPDYVIETFQKGYMLNGKVLRPAMVKVSK
ncbi:MAG: nucleotide exchange factor GrpE [Tissierellia bacterium]|nr:nucleotide exchange factor GrpE [Tissierellia bacterium]